MKTLIVDDDFTSRLLMQKLMQRYGECHIAVNGAEAVRAAMVEHEAYDLVCLDVMMPLMDGQTALREIRQSEAEAGIVPRHRVKIIMTTALGDRDSINDAVQGQCDWFLVKPIDKLKLLEILERLGLTKQRPWL